MEDTVLWFPGLACEVKDPGSIPAVFFFIIKHPFFRAEKCKIMTGMDKNKWDKNESADLQFSGNGKIIHQIRKNA